MSPPVQPGAARSPGHAAGVAILWISVFLSGFVMREPAPFDLMMVPVMAGWLLFGGGRLHRLFLPAFVLIVLFIAGGLVATTQVTSHTEAPLYMAVSAFMAALFVFFANLVGRDPRTLTVIRNALLLSSGVAASFGILGYFGAFPGAETFTLYDRARGTFQDPNVFGPFLVLPITLLVHDFLTRPLRRTLWLLPLLLWLSLALFLSFSRAAWGLALFVLATLTLTVFIADRRPATRLRLIVLSLVGLALISAVLALALSIDQVAEMFEVRAKLVQPYDSHRVGRFARWQGGFAMALENPLGIGPLEFRRFYPEDPHNVYLKAFLAYGWLGGLSYLGLVLWTLCRGFPLLFRDHPIAPAYRCAYLVFVGHALIGVIIDTDHWRHAFLLYGLVWGCFIVYQRDRAAARRPLASRGRWRPVPAPAAAMAPTRV